MKKQFLVILLLLSLLNCTHRDQKSPDASALFIGQHLADPWRRLWYDGNAEISTYEVAQARYTDIHPGKTVLIFVTEDFLTDKQVKNEQNGKPSASVLKTNMVRHFNTGIYDYSMMTSVFTPVDKKQFPHTLKISTSSQDWCGHSWMQLNHQKNRYNVSQYSYFQQEGDTEHNVVDLFTEDEIFNQIRLDPTQLPIGSQEILPGTVFTRLRHIAFQPYQVEITIQASTSSGFSGQDLQVYTVFFPEFDRTLKIYYEKMFPYNIAGWTDSYPSLGGEKLTTVAKQITSKRLPYWSLHDAEDAHLRAEIGL